MSLPYPIPSFTQGFARSAGESLFPNLWKGLVGLWTPYVGVQGQILYDWSGNKNDGALTNMTNSDWVPGKHGWALDFDPTDDFVLLGNPNSLNFGTGDFTVSVDVKIAPNSNNTPIFGNRPQGGVGTVTGWYVSILGTGKPYIQIEDGLGGAATVSADSAIDDSLWHHIDYVFKRNTNGEIYIDGGLDKTGNISGQSGDLDNALDKSIRKAFGTAAPFFGDAITISSVSVYNRALLSQEIALLFTIPYAPLILADGLLAFLAPIAPFPIFSEEGIHSNIFGGLVVR